MLALKNLKELSFLIYGLGLTGNSVVNFFKKNEIYKYKIWDDNNKKLYKKGNRCKNLKEIVKKTDFIILSPGINLNKSKNKKILLKYKKKIITDIDLIYLTKKNLKTIVVTGTNGKSTTCKMIHCMLKNNNHKVVLGGNIGTPVLNLNIKKKDFLIIEASSFQLAYSKFVCPDYALFLNITNDHLDWHGNMKNYINSKLKIFKLQKKNQYSLIRNKDIKKLYNKKFSGKLIKPNVSDYKKIKSKIKNTYIKSNINNENMSFVYSLSKLLKIKLSLFLESLNNFTGLPHRYEIFLKKKGISFINDSKATTFQASKFALQNTKNIFWILGGLPKKNDKFMIKKIKNKIIKAYIIGKNQYFFKKQIKDKLEYHLTGNLKNSILKILSDIKSIQKKENSILLSPAAASYDQYLNFEKRGEEFKKLSRYYARKLI